MAKKLAVDKGVDEVTPMTGVLVHRNHQLMGVDATTIVLEAVATPGYADGTDGAMQVVAAWITSGVSLTDKFVAAGEGKWRTQIQTSDRVAAAAMRSPVQVGFFAEVAVATALSTNGMSTIIEPIPVPVLTPSPFITTPGFTIAHQGANQANHNDMNVYTIIWYRKVRLPLRQHSMLLQNQLRTS